METPRTSIPPMGEEKHNSAILILQSERNELLASREENAQLRILAGHLTVEVEQRDNTIAELRSELESIERRTQVLEAEAAELCTEEQCDDRHKEGT